MIDKPLVIYNAYNRQSVNKYFKGPFHAHFKEAYFYHFFFFLHFPGTIFFQSVLCKVLIVSLRSCSRAVPGLLSYWEIASWKAWWIGRLAPPPADKQGLRWKDNMMKGTFWTRRGCKLQRGRLAEAYHCEAVNLSFDRPSIRESTPGGNVFKLGTNVQSGLRDELSLILVVEGRGHRDLTSVSFSRTQYISWREKSLATWKWVGINIPLVNF